MESLGRSQKDVQSRNKWKRRIKGQPANQGSPGKMAIKTECVYYSVNILSECLHTLIDCSQLSKTYYCCSVVPLEKITHKASDAAENLQL